MSTEISFSSSEAVVKALKSNTISDNEKIKIANSIWKGKQEHEFDTFPHKEVFLAEWVSSSLVKSVGGKAVGEQQLGFEGTQQQEQLTSPAYLNQEYWILIQDILEFITRKWQTAVTHEINYIGASESAYTILQIFPGDDGDCEKISSSLSSVHSENITNTIRTIRILANSFNKIPITIAFSAVVNSIASSLDNAKRILDSNDVSTKATEILNIFEQSSNLFQIVMQCFDHFTTAFSINSLDITMYRPTLDHLTTLGLNTCNLYRSLIPFVDRSFDTIFRKSQKESRLANLLISEAKTKTVRAVKAHEQKNELGETSYNYENVMCISDNQKIITIKDAIHTGNVLKQKKRKRRDELDGGNDEDEKVTPYEVASVSSSINNFDAGIFDDEDNDSLLSSKLISLRKLILEFSSIVLRSLEKILLAISNPKKAYNIVFGKLLNELLQARHVLLIIKEKSFKEDEESDKNEEIILDKTIKHINRIIRFGLFQQEHLLEYVTIERDESWKLSLEHKTDKSNNDEKAPIASGYQKLFFDRIYNMMQNSSIDRDELSNPVVVMQAFPMLFQLFFEEIREKNESNDNNSRTPIKHLSLDKLRTFVFNFFVELLALLNQIISLAISGKEQMITLQIALGTQNQLISLLLHYNIYRPSNDEISQRQFVFLQTFMERLMNLANLYSREGMIQSSIFKTINYVLQLDLRVVDPHMEKLCEYLLLPSLDSDNECRSLIITFIEIYAKSREMERFLQCIFNGLKTMNANVVTLLRKPLYSIHVSIAQAHEIINIFINELIGTYFSEKIATTSYQKSNPRKKRKINSENEHLSPINDDNNTADLQVLPSPGPLIILFIHFLKVFKSAASSRFNERLKEPLQKLFDGFISPVLLSQSFDTIHETFLDRIIVPTLFLHCSLVDLFSVSYLKIYSAKNFVDGLFETVSNIKTPKVKLIMNKSIFQHIYLTNSNNLSVQTLITTVLETLLNNSEDTASLDFSWTGQLVDLTEDNFMIANAKLIINDWLDVVCNTCQESELVNIVRFIIKIFTSSSIDGKNSQGSINPQEVNLHNICVELARSAQFFEISNIRDVFIKTFFEELFGFVKQQIKDKKTLKQQNITELLDFLLPIISHQAIVTTPNFWKSLLPFFKPDLPITPAESSLFPITKVSAYFRTLLIFPIEYFEKREKDAILAVAFIVEKLILSLFRARNLADLRDILEFSLVCRSLTNRIVKIGNRENILRHYGEFLEWWMTSITSHSRQISEMRQNSDGSDDGNIVTSLHSNLVQITSEVLYTTIYQVLNRSRDKDVPFNHEYWKGVISIFKTLSRISLSIDQFSSWINAVNEKELELENNVDLRFLGDFLEACMDYFEKNNRSTRIYNREQKTITEKKIWDSFSGLCASLEQDLLKILDLWVNNTTNNLKNDDRTNQKIWAQKSAQMKNVLRVYSILLRHHRISIAHEIKSNNNNGVSSALGLLPRFLTLPIPLLRIAIEPIYNNITEKDNLRLLYSFNSEIVEIATTLFALALKFFADFDPPVSDVTISKIMALFWVMLKIVHDKVPIAEHLKFLFGNFIQKLSNEQYESIILCLLQKLGQLSYSFNSNVEQEITVFLVIVDLIFRESKQDQKKQLRKDFTQTLSGLCSIGQTTKLLNNRIRLLNVLASIVANKDFHLKGNDVSLVLSASVTIMSSSLSSTNRENTDATKKNTKKDIFDATCCLLHNLIRYNREQLASSFPSQNIYNDGQTHNGVHNNNGEEPLSVLDAEKLSRLLMILSKKQLSTQQPTNNDHERVDPTSASSQKVFAKYIPFVIVEYLGAQVDGRFSPQIRDALKSGVYALLDMCGERERDLIMVACGKVGKEIFKNLWKEYQNEWKYTGRG
ncbi:12091_t:CDS:10 [Ambispora leptoticha]|uniref:12091_t:CDS:1 n=1 Tax=Ambispora leptoticha TaxID=144679 RepID=A0A9N8V6C2_9GLOM|nr:12091_t:CDS:10 [Ambispora leptoticha]